MRRRHRVARDRRRVLGAACHALLGSPAEVGRRPAGLGFGDGAAVRAEQRFRNGHGRAQRRRGAAARAVAPTHPHRADGEAGDGACEQRRRLRQVHAAARGCGGGGGRPLRRRWLLLLRRLRRLARRRVRRRGDDPGRSQPVHPDVVDPQLDAWGLGRWGKVGLGFRLGARPPRGRRRPGAAWPAVVQLSSKARGREVGRVGGSVDAVAANRQVRYQVVGLGVRVPWGWGVD